MTKLGFGHADVVVAVPQAWLDVSTMADLADVAARFRLKHHRPMRVATKYVSLTRRFLTGHGVHDYLIVESPGATEGAPAAGTAELIVDITSTGRTLVENGLKIVDDGVIMRSEAALVAALGATWSETARAAARTMLTRIAADARARSVKRIEAAIAPSPALVRPWNRASRRRSRLPGRRWCCSARPVRCTPARRIWWRPAPRP